MIRAFIFDLDGVLTDTARYHYLAWKRLADEIGVPFDEQRNEALRGVDRRRSLELLLQGRPHTPEAFEAWMARKNGYYQELIQQMTPADLLPGALDFLKACREAGLRVAIGSASKNAQQVLDALQLGPWVDAVADGYSVERHKPAPDLFLKAAELLGLDPGSCVVVEDAEAGVLAARAGGMLSLGIGPVSRVGAADYVVPDLAHTTLSEVLEALNGPWQPERPEQWVISEDQLPTVKMIRSRETLFTIGNGYLGTRGSFEEGYPGDQPATLVHGFFDDAPVVYTELANVPNWTRMTLVLNGERFRLDQGELLSYRRTLDLRAGLLKRNLRWRSPQGQTIELEIERFASLAHPHVLGLRYRLTALDFSGQVELRAELDGRVHNDRLIHLEPVAQGAWDAQSVYLHMRTVATGLDVVEGMDVQVYGGRETTLALRDCEQVPAVSIKAGLRPGETLLVDKLVTLYTSRESSTPVTAAQEALQEARRQGYAALRLQNARAWQDEWDAADVLIDGDDEADRAVRYSIFQLLIAGPRWDDRVNIGARTLSGFGYRGHAFWDTEIFMLPLFTFTRPQIARNLLLYRYHTLPGARRKAQAAGYEGAMYAWESAATGDETTPRWLPGPKGEGLVRVWCSDLEQHISADVAYAVLQYWRVTGDDAFMRDYGAEIVLDTARFWASRAEWNPEKQRYDINDIIGPDEYHERVNNNAFTNAMARWNIQEALRTLEWLHQHAPDKANELMARLDLTPERLRRWVEVMEGLYIPYDPQTGLIEQFEGFFQLEKVDLAAYEPRTQSMHAIFGVEGIQKVQVIKQPDVLMLLYLLGETYPLSAVRANWDYYTPMTDLTYGSSLGPATQALMAARAGLLDEALQAFRLACGTDLYDVRGNAADGVHGATAGGIWQAVVFGFGGLYVDADGYRILPHLPPHWSRLRYQFYWRGEKVTIDLRHTHSE